jgi:hypothetical protein
MPISVFAQCTLFFDILASAQCGTVTAGVRHNEPQCGSITTSLKYVALSGETGKRLTHGLSQQ